MAGFHSTGAIVAEIEDTRDWEEGKDGRGRDLSGVWQACPQMIVQVTDCSRPVSFEFNLATSEERRNSFYKIDAMIDSLTAFREGMVIECQLLKKRVKSLPEDDD